MWRACVYPVYVRVVALNVNYLKPRRVAKYTILPAKNNACCAYILYIYVYTCQSTLVGPMRLVEFGISDLKLNVGVKHFHFRWARWIFYWLQSHSDTLQDRRVSPRTLYASPVYIGRPLCNSALAEIMKLPAFAFN